jgi:rubrerythrin
MANTQENLQAALAGESQASRKYAYFGEKADKEGQPQIAKLFRAASEAETVHARNHLNAMSGIKTTADNLKEAISGEHYEFSEMYPGFITQAKTETNNRAEKSFDYANQVEKIHHSLYQQALKDVEAGKKLESKPYYVCQVCGNTVEGEAPDKCPICGVPKTMFKRID